MAELSSSDSDLRASSEDDIGNDEEHQHVEKAGVEAGLRRLKKELLEDDQHAEDAGNAGARARLGTYLESETRTPLHKLCEPAAATVARQALRYAVLSASRKLPESCRYDVVAFRKRPKEASVQDVCWCPDSIESIKTKQKEYGEVHADLGAPLPSRTDLLVGLRVALVRAFVDEIGLDSDSRTQEHLGLCQEYTTQISKA